MVNETAGNETTMNRTLKAIVLSAGLCSLPNLCFPAIVYDNSFTDLNQFYPTNREAGDQITLFGTDRTLSQFRFEYFFSGATASTQTWTLRMYANTGLNSSPAATPFYASDPIAVELGVGGYNNKAIDFPLIITLPDTFTWTVQFSNLAANEQAGLRLFGPPTVGDSFNDFWQNDGAGVWSRLAIVGVARSDFAAQVSAVPEPGVLALGGLGVLLLAGLRRFRKAPG